MHREREDDRSVWRRSAVLVAFTAFLIAACGNRRTAETEQRAAVAERADVSATRHPVPEACDALHGQPRESFPVDWATTQGRIRDAFDHVPWFEGRYAWLALHPIDGTLAVCGIGGTEADALIRAIVQRARRDGGRGIMGEVLRTEAKAHCAFGLSLASADRNWRSDDFDAWGASCANRFNVLNEPISASRSGDDHDPDVVRDPHARTATATQGVCVLAHLLREQRDAMCSGTLSDDDWISYGKTLAACPPVTKPWDAVGVGSRDRYREDYVLRYLNGDAARGGLFSSRARAALDALTSSWGIDGG